MLPLCIFFFSFLNLKLSLLSIELSGSKGGKRFLSFLMVFPVVYFGHIEYP